jgi:transketolase
MNDLTTTTTASDLAGDLQRPGTARATGSYDDLAATALRVREHVVRMATGGGCFVGSALSCVDLLVYLYGRHLNLSPARLDDPLRDYFFLSKGHAVPALYGVLVEHGLMAQERLADHLTTRDSIYWHPNRDVPGVEFHAGSLGHLLAVAAGVALDCKLRGHHNRIVVLVGDGELNEGSNWEACLVAHAHRLDNLVMVVERRLCWTAGTCRSWWPACSSARPGWPRRFCRPAAARCAW